jgi:hypothetical protein
MRTSLEKLVEMAESYGEATASDGRWWAERHYDFWGDSIVTVGHHSTVMLRIDMTSSTVHPMSKGWGSMTDKCGIRKILKNVTGQGYAEVYADF